MASRLKFSTQMVRFRKRVQEEEYKQLRIKRLACTMRNVHFLWENRYRWLCKQLNHEP